MKQFNRLCIFKVCDDGSVYVPETTLIYVKRLLGG